MKEIKWTLDEEKDEAEFYISEDVDWADVSVVITELADRFNINLKNLENQRSSLSKEKEDAI